MERNLALRTSRSKQIVPSLRSLCTTAMKNASRMIIALRFTTLLVSLFLLLAGPAMLAAQEVRANVSVDALQLPVDLQEEVAGFAGELERYIGTTGWYGDGWEGKQLDVTITVGFTESLGDDTYRAQLVFVSQRDIYKSPSPSPMMRVLDPDWTFKYTRNQQFQQNTATYDQITSLVDFYIYIALGLDLDTYGFRAGDELYDRALTISRRGELETSAGRATGWGRKGGGGGFSRFNLITELTNSRYFPIREFLLNYHYNGLDRLSEYPDRALDSLSGYITNLVEIKDRLVSASTLIRMINDTKHIEFATTFKGYRDPTIWARLLYLDPTHQSVYERARDGR